jgi:hypothetical protein
MWSSMLSGQSSWSRSATAHQKYNHGDYECEEYEVGDCHGVTFRRMWRANQMAKPAHDAANTTRPVCVLVW